MEKNEIFNSMQGPDLTWKQIVAILLNQDPDIFPDSLRKIVSDRLDPNHCAQEMTALEELGLFSDMVPERHLTPLDTLVPHLAKALAYGPGERDLVILNHDIETQLPAGSVVGS